MALTMLFLFQNLLTATRARAQNMILFCHLIPVTRDQSILVPAFALFLYVILDLIRNPCNIIFLSMELRRTGRYFGIRHQRGDLFEIALTRITTRSHTAFYASLERVRISLLPNFFKVLTFCHF